MKIQQIQWLLLDAFLAIFAFLVAYFLRFLPEHVGSLVVEREYPIYLRQALLVFPFFLLIRLSLFYLFDLYRGISRYAGLHELRQIVFSVSSGSSVLLLWNLVILLFPQGKAFPMLASVPAHLPWSVLIIDWMACLILIGGSRLVVRFWAISRFQASGTSRNVLIIGASEVGELAARSFLQNPGMGYRPVGFVDEDKRFAGHLIHGLPVLGDLDGLPNVIENHGVSDVLVAVPRPSLRFLNRVVEICENARVSFKMVPAVSDLMEERISVNQIRNVEIEDLLGREPVDLSLDLEMNYLQDEVILVTGAGGSIGSELCRQILRAGPRQLIMLGHGENSLYEIANELHFRFGEGRLPIVVADVKDVARMEQVFAKYKPTVVFHAAAHKHVPLMEMHPSEAVKNNIIGTFNVAFLARSHDAKRFILISTDKAVHPTSVMGTSKRLAEMIVAALSAEGETVFLAVRFGNVLGSNGSVVPLFKKQIRGGGPVTVTHPDVERYFMTIPEAVNLVLQAGAMGQNGQLFLLDMGEPVKIHDLARRMITLSGYEPNVDIEIQFTGLRPGEKLKEELLTATEDLSPTAHPQIFATRVEKPSLDEVKGWLRELDSRAEEGDDMAIVLELQRIVPEFTPDFDALRKLLSGVGSPTAEAEKVSH